MLIAEDMNISCLMEKKRKKAALGEKYVEVHFANSIIRYRIITEHDDYKNQVNSVSSPELVRCEQVH